MADQPSLRIAVMANRFPQVSEAFILNQIVGLIERGHQVDIFADSGPDPGTPIHAGVARHSLLECTLYRPAMPSRLTRIATLPRLLLRQDRPSRRKLLRGLDLKLGLRNVLSLGLIYKALSTVNRQPYDIIHCHFGENGQRAALLRHAGLIHGRIITTFHGHDVNSLPMLRGRDCYKSLFELGDRYTVNTTFTGERAQSLGCPADRIHVLPMGVDLKLFGFRSLRPEPGEPFRIVTVARFTEKKGLGVLHPGGSASGRTPPHPLPAGR